MRGNESERESGLGYRGRLTLYETSHCVAGLRTSLDPVRDTIAVEPDLSRLPARVVVTDDFEKSPIAFKALFRYNDSIVRVLFGTFSRESYC